MNFKSKASTLKKINTKKAIIPKIFFFKVGKFNKNKKIILNKIKRKFSGKIAIRSSAFGEDSKTQSLAGKYKSFLNIDPKNIHLVNKKINEVINSYENNSRKNEILIQKMVNNVKMSGVATSCDKDTFAPYFIINYSYNQNTDRVTAGKKDTQNFVFYKYSKKKTKK